MGATIYLQYTSFSFGWLLLRGSTGSRALGCQQLQHESSVLAAPGLESTGSIVMALAQLLCGMWDLPRPGTKPVSPALVGGLFTPDPAVKPYHTL